MLVAAEPRGELREREVGRGVLEGFARAAPGVRDGRDVVEREPLVERRALAHARDPAPLVAQVERRRHRGRPQQRLERGAHVEARAAEGVDGRHGRRGRVALHHVGRARVVRPAIPDAVVLVRLVQQRLRHVAGGVGIDQRHQVDLRAVHVPAREVRVLGALALVDSVDLLVEAPVLAVDVARQVHVEQRVVERRVEHHLLVGRAAGDPDAPERVVPGPAGGRSQRVERGGVGVLGLEIRAGVGEADVRDPHADVHRRGVAHVEPDVRPRAEARRRIAVVAVRRAAARGGRARRQRVVVPRAHAGKRPVEHGDKVQGVVAAAVDGAEVAAEVAARHRAGDGAGVRIDRHGRVARSNL